jgi:hypothetical protein
MSEPVKVLYTGRSSNRQTGDVPTAWVGDSYEEAMVTCKASGCLYFGKGTTIGDSKCRCYAWEGHGRSAFASVIKAYNRRPEKYTIKAAIQRSVRSARMLRLSAIGDPSAIREPEALQIVETCREVDLDLVGYLAGWRIAPWWKGILRASCTTEEDAREALSLGWQATRVAPWDATEPPGEGVMCPTKMGKKINCNQCRMCQCGDSYPDVIWFPDHTPLEQAHRARRRLREERKKREQQEQEGSVG